MKGHDGLRSCQKHCYRQSWQERWEVTESTTHRRHRALMMMFQLQVYICDDDVLSVPLNLLLLRMPCWKMHLFLSHPLSQTQTHRNHIPLTRSFVFRIFFVGPCMSLFCILLTGRRYFSPFRYASPSQSFTTSVPNALKVSFISQLPPKVAILTCYV